MKAIIFVFVIAFILFAAILLYITRPEWENKGANQIKKGHVPIAVLGDSDSHVYRDEHHQIRRGGDFHEVTFQWTEVLAHLRSNEVGLGKFGYWGTRGTVSRIRSKLGLDARTPRKQDFQYNFAFSGATCQQLAPNSYQQQSLQLVKLMDKDPGYWQKGLVIIRIGINDFGQWSALKKYEEGKLSIKSRQRIVECVDHISNAVELIRSKHPNVKIALIGIVDNSDLPYKEETDDAGHANINKVLDIFDEGMMELANNDPNILFIEDRQWFSRILGRGGTSGYVGQRHLGLGGATTINNTQGDHPENIVLADRHASTVFNALWIRHVLEHINSYFGLGFTPLLYSEIADLVDPHGDLGIAAPKPALTDGPTLDADKDHLEISLDELLEFQIHFEAKDSAGTDISETATAFIDSGSGNKLWLFNAGKDIRLDPVRHTPGEYVLQLQVQDRYRQAELIRIPVTIYE